MGRNRFPFIEKVCGDVGCTKGFTIWEGEGASLGPEIFLFFFFEAHSL